MVTIQFLDSLETTQATVTEINDHVVEVSGSSTNLSGFYVYSNHDILIGNYSSFKTLYRTFPDRFQLSDDGSVYTPPEIVPDPEPTIEALQENKINEMESMQQAIIAGGCDVQLSDGTTEHFTLTQNDQLSLNSLSVKAIEGLTAIPWHTSNEDAGCVFYSEEDMKRITDTCASFVTWHVTWFRDLRRYIRSLTSKEDVEAITYDTTIPVRYQSEVLQALLLQKSGGSLNAIS